MDVLSIEEMIALEKRAFASGITGHDLMTAAGEAMAARILEIYSRASEFLVLVGKGNNGGDGLVVARELAAAEKKCALFLPPLKKLWANFPS